MNYTKCKVMVVLIWSQHIDIVCTRFITSISIPTAIPLSTGPLIYLLYNHTWSMPVQHKFQTLIGGISKNERIQKVGTQIITGNWVVSY